MKILEEILADISNSFDNWELRRLFVDGRGELTVLHKTKKVAIHYVGSLDETLSKPFILHVGDINITYDELTDNEIGIVNTILDKAISYHKNLVKDLTIDQIESR